MNNHNHITKEELIASIEWLIRDGCDVFEDESGRYVAEWPTQSWLFRRKYGNPYEDWIHAIREGRRATGDLSK